MAKLLILILAGLAAYLIIKNYRRRVERDAGSQSARTEESMVRCAECGVHHPRSESLLSNGKFYCCTEHERRFRARS